MTDYALNRIKEVVSKREFDQLMEGFKTSNQPLEIREECIEELKKHYPFYDTSNRLPNKELRQMMEACAADIDGLEAY